MQGIQYTILDSSPSDNVSLIEQKIHPDREISTNNSASLITQEADTSSHEVE